MDDQLLVGTEPELDLVRETLADDILTILAVKDSLSPHDTGSSTPVDLQRLLCAAVADLEEVDDQLHQQRIRCTRQSSSSSSFTRP